MFGELVRSCAGRGRLLRDSFWLKRGVPVRIRTNGNGLYVWEVEEKELVFNFSGDVKLFSPGSTGSDVMRILNRINITYWRTFMVQF